MVSRELQAPRRRRSNGGSPWADYWRETITELRGDLVKSGKLTDTLIDAFLAQCADPNWWTQTIAFTAVHLASREGLSPKRKKISAS